MNSPLQTTPQFFISVTYLIRIQRFIRRLLRLNEWISMGSLKIPVFLVIFGLFIMLVQGEARATPVFAPGLVTFQNPRDIVASDFDLFLEASPGNQTIFREATSGGIFSNPPSFNRPNTFVRFTGGPGIPGNGFYSVNFIGWDSGTEFDASFTYPDGTIVNALISAIGPTLPVLMMVSAELDPPVPIPPIEDFARVAAVPEPSTYLLFLYGVIGIIGMRFAPMTKEGSRYSTS